MNRGAPSGRLLPGGAPLHLQSIGLFDTITAFTQAAPDWLQVPQSAVMPQAGGALARKPVPLGQGSPRAGQSIAILRSGSCVTVPSQSQSNPTAGFGLAVGWYIDSPKYAFLS